MAYIGRGLDSVVAQLSDQNYTQSLAFYRLWFDIGQTYNQIPSDRIFDAIWNNRGLSSTISPHEGKLTHSGAHLILRFASDVESDHILAPHTSELQSRLCATSLREFFDANMRAVENTKRGNSSSDSIGYNFFAEANLIAHWTNLGYVKEAAIRNHILQSLISHQKLYDHQADALVILFKIAGATFEAYVDPSVVDRCFDLLKHHNYPNPYDNCHNSTLEINSRAETRREQLLVRADHIVKAGRRAETDFQEVLALRERGWEGLPPPPTFTTGRPNLTSTNQNDPTATPVATSLGLPNGEPEPQILQPPPPEPAAVPQLGPVPASPITPATQSPTISIATLSDFTIADASDDESSINPTATDASDDEPPVDPMAITPHDTFYLEDGNVEVLCGNTLFRVHTTILSFHSPALRRMFSQTSLATAESPNGCPRILSSDAPKDFSTLLKMIYLPGFLEWSEAPDFATFSSLLRITAKYEMPTVRSRVLKVVRDAYPETFQGLAPSKLLGESVFSSPTPHPNEVLNLFVQQNLTSALPMAYYMAIRRGPNSLVGGHLSRNATLSPEILQAAFRGLMGLREVELNETHRLVFGPKGPHPCSASNCHSRTPTGPAALEAYQKVLDRIVGSSQLGTKVLQVPELYEDFQGVLRCVGPGICSGCVERWESGHAELRKKAWGMLPDVFGLNG